MRSSLSALIIILTIIGGVATADRTYATPLKLTESEVAKIRSVISGQLQAFRSDDARKAFSYAAPSIKEKFKTPKKFLKMVRRYYFPVYRPRDFEFRPIQMVDDKIIQPLAVIGPSGVQEIVLYSLEQQPDHSWKIGSCIMINSLGEET